MPIKRYEMTDEQWEQIRSLFPVYKTGRPPKDNRLMFNAILWIARSGAAWRDLPARYDLKSDIFINLYIFIYHYKINFGNILINI